MKIGSHETSVGHDLHGFDKEHATVRLVENVLDEERSNGEGEGDVDRLALLSQFPERFPVWGVSSQNPKDLSQGVEEWLLEACSGSPVLEGLQPTVNDAGSLDPVRLGARSWWTHGRPACA